MNSEDYVRSSLKQTLEHCTAKLDSMKDRLDSIDADELREDLLPVAHASFMRLNECLGPLDSGVDMLTGVMNLVAEGKAEVELIENTDVDLDTLREMLSETETEIPDTIPTEWEAPDSDKSGDKGTDQ